MPADLPLPAARTIADLRETVSGWKRQGFTVGFVPTMGALHDGHLSLVREAKRRADKVVTSVFVNPTQFAPTEDLDAYPRQEGRDAELLAGAGCDLLYAPAVAEMYPEGVTTTISVGGPAEGLEGAFRPQMFGGVALVVSKLLHQVQPDLAVFGEKDWQQLMVVRRMVRDLDMPVQIIGLPTARDGHGLALSSRNAYLSEAELETARKLNGVLAEAGIRARDGSVAEAEQWARRRAESRRLRQRGLCRHSPGRRPVGDRRRSGRPRPHPRGGEDRADASDRQYGGLKRGIGD